MACGSFFHYAGGFTKPEAFDLNLPEVNVVGKAKDAFFPQPRLDFYACVQARKRKDSPHGKDRDRDIEDGDVAREIEGEKYRPKVKWSNGIQDIGLTPYY